MTSPSHNRAAFSQPAGEAIPELSGIQTRALMVGGLFAVISAIGFLSNREQFMQSYLMGYMWVLGATLGSLALAMVHQLSGGEWGVLIRRPASAATRVLPLLTVLFLPIALSVTHIYPWASAHAGEHHDHVLQHKEVYLNVPFFLARAAFYFLVWNALVFLLNKWGLQQDQNPSPELAKRMQRLSAGGLVLYVLTMTFASLDWLMSLDPHWYSTMYGALVIGGQGLTAVVLMAIVTVWLSRRAPMDAVIVPQHTHDLGNLMLAFTMIWAYFSFSQYLIIWAGNLPAEIAWYMHRSFTSWKVLATILVFFHFAAPFTLLLFRGTKRKPNRIIKVASLILFARLVDFLWLVAPEFHHEGFSVSWMDATLPLALGGIWVWAFVGQLKSRAILPVNDPQFNETLGQILDGTRAHHAH